MSLTLMNPNEFDFLLIDVDWLRIASQSSPIEETDCAAIVTSNQFKSLGWYSKTCFEDEEMYMQYIYTLKKRDLDKINLQWVKSQLLNSWNTERLLRFTKENFTENSDGFVIQWVFPQAYYSVFNSTLAFFEVAGHSERTHAAVRRKVADLAHAGRYPRKLCVLCDGSKENIVVGGLDCSKDGFQPLVYLESDENNKKCHIHSYLKSTREIDLKKKREDMKNTFKTKKGGRKKSLTSLEWKQVSDSLKKTSWLCLLYRKRLKANYQNIDTFLSSELEVSEILHALLELVNVLNFTSELNIYQSIGDKIVEWNNDKYEFINNRIERIYNLYDLC